MSECRFLLYTHSPSVSRQAADTFLSEEGLACAACGRSKPLPYEQKRRFVKKPDERQAFLVPATGIEPRPRCGEGNKSRIMQQALF